jgi:hypothetical protein
MKDHLSKAEYALKAAADPGSSHTEPVLTLQYALAQAEGTLALVHEVRLLREALEDVS